jgi:holo-[acyl-carrier protein] synthase
LIVGVGIDLVEIARVDDLVRKFGERARERVFTPRELEIAGAGPGAAASLAARFAAKEAAMKALGTGWAEGIGFADVEVDRDPSGAPRLRLHRAAAQRAQTLGATRYHVALTHAQATAGAVVILESGSPPPT